MEERANHALSAQFSAAFAWWRDAGVDCAFHDEPVNWVAPPPEQAAGQPAARIPAKAPPPAAPAPPTIEPGALPQDLAAFTQWWLTEPLLDDGRVAGRVPPRGTTGAEVMIVVPEPEREDSDLLLSGPQGRLLDAMLAAMGVAPEKLYLASALPRHTPMADWSAAGGRGLGAALCRHVELVAPGRLIVFGSNVLPLLGHDPTNSGQISPQFNHGGQSVPLLAAVDLTTMHARPRAKSKVWQQWLEWTGSDRMGS